MRLRRMLGVRDGALITFFQHITLEVWLSPELEAEDETLDTKGVLQLMAGETVVGVGRGTRLSPRR